MRGEEMGVTIWISTHALTWRATWTRTAMSPAAENFYPRPHMEGDHVGGDNFFFGIKFLPTPSHGGRLSADVAPRLLL